jgi:guanylate kinase
MAHLVVLAGPSGVGKSTVISAALTALPNTWLSVSATTRAPRPGEQNGREYFFVSNEEFDQMVANDALLEWAEYAGNRYGTPRAAVQERLAQNIPVLLEIEVQGATQVRRSDPEAVLVFLNPPSWQALETRLRGRGTEAEAVIQARLDLARQEIAAANSFDHVITNDDVHRAAQELVSYLR